jgi:phenylalanyl-tRNA synthetase alpha chain
MTDYDALPQLEEEGRTRIEAATTLDELAAVEADLVGRTSVLVDLQKRLGSLAPEERKAAGQAVNAARAALNVALSARRSALEAEARTAQLEAERLDLTEVRPTWSASAAARSSRSMAALMRASPSSRSCGSAS